MLYVVLLSWGIETARDRIRSLSYNEGLQMDCVTRGHLKQREILNYEGWNPWDNLSNYPTNDASSEIDRWSRIYSYQHFPSTRR